MRNRWLIGFTASLARGVAATMFACPLFSPKAEEKTEREIWKAIPMAQPPVPKPVTLDLPTFAEADLRVRITYNPSPQVPWVEPRSRRDGFRSIKASRTYERQLVRFDPRQRSKVPVMVQR